MKIGKLLEQAEIFMDKENPQKNFIQKAEESLYGEQAYVSVGDKLYLFTGTRHELQSKALEQRRIFEWLSTYAGRYDLVDLFASTQQLPVLGRFGGGF